MWIWNCIYFVEFLKMIINKCANDFIDFKGVFDIYFRLETWEPFQKIATINQNGYFDH